MVVKSQDLPLYNKALKGIKKVYPANLPVFNLEGEAQRPESVVKAIGEENPDMIISIGPLATRMVQDQFPDTPLVFCMVFETERFPVSRQNTTGVFMDIAPRNLLSRMKELFPDARRIGLLYDPEKNRKKVDEAREAANSLGIALIASRVSSEKEVPGALRSLLENIDLLWLAPDSTVVTSQSLEFLFITSFENRIPIVTFSDDLVRKGAVAAFSPDYEGVGEQAANLARRVLKGEKIRDLPAQKAEKVQLSVNSMTAKKLNIRLNPKVAGAAEIKIE